jgi:hypothetical protein
MASHGVHTPLQTQFEYLRRRLQALQTTMSFYKLPVSDAADLEVVG